VKEAPETTVKAVEEVEVAPKATPHATNSKPPGTPCKRIGEGTKKAIIAYLRDKDTVPLVDIAKAIKQKPDATAALLALLWERDLINYDSTTDWYYLP
jgi:hypothetical protein